MFIGFFDLEVGTDVRAVACGVEFIGIVKSIDWVDDERVVTLDVNNTDVKIFEFDMDEDFWLLSEK